MREIEWYRRVSEEYRALGDHEDTQKTKEFYYGLAADYDHMARQVAEIETSKKVLWSRRVG